MTHPRQLARLLAGAILCLFALTWLESPLRAPAGRRIQMLAVAPQFWGYFAAPLQDRMELFRLRGGAWVRADFPLSSPRNLFGLRRGPVLHSTELRALLREAQPEWSEATLRESDVPEATTPGVSVRNLARQPQLCGDVLVVERTPVPWAWASSRRGVSMPVKYARLDVQC
jgi:antimicrobial peptide system SdpA family protein